MAIVSGVYNTITANNWHHVAITKSGDTYRLFVDGTMSDERTQTNLSIDFTGVLIGKNGWDAHNGEYTGYLDELRVTKGVARYTASFTPPTSPFPNY